MHSLTEISELRYTTPEIRNFAGEKWITIYKSGAIAAAIMILFIPVQMIIYFSSPPPVTVEGFFDLFSKNKILGLLEYDLLFIIDAVLMIFILTSLYFILRKEKASLSTIGFALGLTGIASYFASNTSLEMLSLSGKYAAAATAEEKAIYLAAGHAVYEIYTGTAFAVYYVLSAISLLLFSYVMLRGHVFSKLSGYTGLVAGILMLVPPVPATGKTGILLSLLSLIPWMLWLVLFAGTTWKLARLSASVRASS